MPTLLSAKDICEQSLMKVGRFPTSQDQPNIIDLKRAFKMFELVLQSTFGEASVTSAWGTLQVPLVAGLTAYPITELSTETYKEGVQFVYGAELITINGGSSRPIDVVTEEKFFKLNQTDVGEPCEIYIDKGESPIIHVHPTLGSEVADNTYQLLLQVQTFPTAISQQGVGARAGALNIRPPWYLWAITKLTYQLGTGTLRRLPEAELTRFKADYEEMELKLLGFDGAENQNQNFTQPWGQDC